MPIASHIDTMGDKQLYQSTASMCAGYLAECLLSLSKYRKQKNQKYLSPTFAECKRFLNDYITSLKKDNDAPFAIRQLVEHLFDVDEKQIPEAIGNWEKTKKALEKAERGEKIDNLENILDFLR